MLLRLDLTKELEILFSFKRPFISSPDKSFPTTPKSLTFEPREDTFKATFAAPPSLDSSPKGVSTGTGDSGESLSALPSRYLSSITSPTTRTFPFFNLFKSADIVLFTHEFIYTVNYLIR